MEIRPFIDQLEANAEVFRVMFRQASLEIMRCRPSPEAWSGLEVLCHLYDEEREDFRQRLELLLEDPERPWPPINPRGWVSERGYGDRDPQAMLIMFLAERTKSLQWLRGLSDPNWLAVKTHPALGSMTAGQLLGCWVAHDLLHMRQLIRLHYLHCAALAGALDLGYAGDW